MADLSLSAVLRFDSSAAIASMGKAEGMFQKLKASAANLKLGFQELGKGFSGIGWAALGIGTSVRTSVKSMLSFEEAMGSLKAGIGKKGADSFQLLEDSALNFGKTTIFTATEAAKTMDVLARSGMSVNAVLSAMPHVLNMASAENMKLDTAATIVASSLKEFQLEAEDSAQLTENTRRVVDALAFASKTTSSSIVGLAEGLTYAGGSAHRAKMSFEDTVSMLGALSDIGVRASMAGTALDNALFQMSNKANKGIIAVGDLDAAIELNADNSLNAKNSFLNLFTAIAEIKNPLERVSTAAKIFGIRGQDVTSAMGAMKKEKVAEMFDNLAVSAKGAADEMAQLRVQNVWGDFEQLKSTLYNVSIEFGKIFSKDITGTINNTKIIVKDTAEAFKILSNTVGLSASEVSTKLLGLNSTSVYIATGIQDGWTGVKSIFSATISVVSHLIEPFLALLSPIDSIFHPERGTIGKSNLISIAMKVGALGIVFKVLGGTISRIGSIATGSFKILKVTLGGAKTGLLALVDVLGKRFPAVGKLAGPLGKLGKGVSALEQITAQPVRVVNFDEIGGIPMGGLPTPGGAPTPGSPITAVTTGVGSAIGSFLLWGATAVGVASLTSIALAVAVGLLSGAGFGILVDHAFGISDWIGKKAVNPAESAARAKIYAQNMDKTAMMDMAGQLVNFAEVGMTSLPGPVPGGPRRSITETNMRQDLMKYTKQPNSGITPEQAKILVEEVMKAMGPRLAEALKGVRLDTVVNIDGRPVAQSVATTNQDKNSRLGRKTTPGQNSQDRRQ